MSTFLYELGGLCLRQRRRVVGLWLLVLLLVGAGAGLFAGKWNDDFTIPGAPGVVALHKLKMTFPSAAANSAEALVLAPAGAKVTDPQIRAVIEQGVRNFDALPVVEVATSPWNEYITGLVNPDGTAALIRMQMATTGVELGAAQRAQLTDEGARLQALLPAGSQVHLGGQAFSIQVPHLSLTEGLGVLVAAVVLVITLGSVLAAGLPLLTALVGVALTMGVITLFTRLMDVNSTTPMLAVMLGLAVGIDYALFIGSRHRDQLRDGLDLTESVQRSVATAGSAVVFAGATVIVALLGLGLAGIPFLTSMGAFAAFGVAIAVVVALTLLPALMGFLGERMRPKAPRVRPDAGPRPARRDPFRWWVGVVTRWPLATIILVTVVMGSLAIPAAGLKLSLPNSGQNPVTAPDRISFDLIRDKFGPGFNGPLIVTADIIGSSDPLGIMAGLKADIEAMDNVALVPIATPNQNADTGMVQVVPKTGPTEDATRDLVLQLRERHDGWQAKYGVNTEVTGMTAIQIDVSDRLGAAMVPFGVFVVGLSLLLLAMVFRSIAVPIKATLGYLLSVGVAFGTTQLVFNRGFGRQLVNLEKSDPVISFLPILVMGILFGLAMDYEVFLVSRMREEYVHGKSAAQAIVEGYAASGKVVVAAAVIMFAVFAFFVPEGSGPIKQIAFALAIGVLADAFGVRMTLVPAVLALLGERAWYLPPWLDRWLPSFDVEGESLARQKRLAGWPTPQHTEALHAEQLVVEGLVGPVDLHLEPGQVHVVSGPLGARTALVLAVCGRMHIDSGRVRSAGFLLPDRASRVRTRTAYLDADISEDPDADLARIMADPPRLVVINNADHLSEIAVAHLRELVDRARSEARVGVLLGVTEPAVIDSLAPDGVLDLTNAEDIR